MSTCAEALALICSFEGYLKQLKDGSGRVVPYLCPAGVPSVGYGSIWRADGTRVAMDDPPITKTEAESLMDLELVRKCEPAIDRLITVKLHPLMYGALVSFVYNCGEGALRGSGLRRAINQQRWADVPKEFPKWRVGGGRVLPGLVRRRSAESAMFMRGVQLLDEPERNTWLTEVLRAAA